MKNTSWDLLCERARGLQSHSDSLPTTPRANAHGGGVDSSESGYSQPSSDQTHKGLAICEYYIINLTYSQHVKHCSPEGRGLIQEISFVYGSGHVGASFCNVR